MIAINPNAIVDRMPGGWNGNQTPLTWPVVPLTSSVSGLRTATSAIVNQQATWCYPARKDRHL
jgi:hypothetical protein